MGPRRLLARFSATGSPLSPGVDPSAGPVFQQPPATKTGHEMNRRIRVTAILLAAAAFSLVGRVTIAQQPPQDPQNWSEVKCSRYKKAWSEALTRRGSEGLGQDFIARHEAFLASGCTARADVCPRSPAELELANIMVLLAMNAGTASTFLPFSCRR